MKKTALQVIATLIIIGAVVAYVVLNWEQFTSIRLSEPLLLIPAFIFMIFNLYSTGMLTELALEPHGVKLNKSEVFGLANLTRFANHVAPGYIGAAVRALYFKRHHNMPLTAFSSSFLISNLLQFIVSGVIALVIFVSYAQSRDSSTGSTLLLVFAALVGFLVILNLPLDVIRGKVAAMSSKYMKHLTQIIDGYVKVRSSPFLIYRIAGWAIISTLTGAAVTVALYYLLGYNINPLAATFIAALGSWGILFSITPANLGIREGLMVFGAQVMGVPLAETLAVAIIFRIVTFSTVGVFSLYYAPRLLAVPVFKITKIKDED